MQEAGYKARLIALAALLVAGAAQADPADLPLEQVDAYLKAAGVTSAWSVSQDRSGSSPETWTIEAFSNRRQLSKTLCATDFRSLEIGEKTSPKDVRAQKPETFYALSNCRYADPGSFHIITGKLDFSHIDDDYALICAAMQAKPPANVKLVLKDPEFRDAFAHLARGDISEIEITASGHLRLTFVTRTVDQLGAPILLSAEVVPGSPPEVVVEMAGYLDMMPVQSER